ncbi:cell wall-binding repeat-containing protein [Gryllotalpicola reticulitermitis]|uniref:Cell wall-binding repeat-containing protein n=1 Tax=Gryllotalpicola reticulitermitis TaxID=1184153 RepID=A0ABV8Q2L2_9MICO
MRHRVLAVLAAAGIAASLLTAVPAIAAAPAPQTAKAAGSGHEHPTVTGIRHSARMGSYAPARFQAQAAKLPASLDAQLRAKLGITPAEFLADGQAAADAAKVVADLRSEGVGVTGSMMHGTALTVSVKDAADEAAVTAAGANATIAAPQPIKTVLTKPMTGPADGSSPLQGGDLWFTETSADSGTECSVGFTGFDKISHAREFVTAGHCADTVDMGGDPSIDGKVYAAEDNTPVGYDEPLELQGQLGTLQQSSFKAGGGYDSGLVSITDSHATTPGTVTTWGATDASVASQGSQSAGLAVPVVGAAAAIAGEDICHSGARTGWQCGTVQAPYDVSYTCTDTPVPHSTTAYADSDCPSGYFQAVDTIDTDVCDLPGDSGGAFVAGDYAVGIESSGDDTPAGDSGAASNTCAGVATTSPYPMVGSQPGEKSVATQQPNFVLGVPEPATSRTLLVDGSGNPTGMSGVLTFADGTPGAAGTPVSLSIDGVAVGSTTSSADTEGNQTWQFALSGLANGAHNYTVTVGTGPSATSSTGTFDAPLSAGAPVVTGTAGANRTLTATAPGASAHATLAYQWVDLGTSGTADAPISGATKATYTPAVALVGHELAVEVIATELGATVTATSAPTAAISTEPAVAGVSVTGIPAVGRVLTASPIDAPAGAALAYQWSANGAPVDGATNGTITLTAPEQGDVISVSVTATAAGYIDATVTGAATAPVAAGSLTTGAVAISGTAKVGQTLTAKPGTWTAGAALTYAWKTGSTTGSGKTFAVPATAYGQKVTLTVTGTLVGYTTASKSASVTVPTYAGPATTRLSGADRYATAVAVSKNSYPKGDAKVVVIASGANFPDALGAAPAAVKLGGPLLLTQPTSLPSVISGEIKRLKPQQIIIVGGPSAVSSGVAASLGRLAPVTRVFGADRYATSLAIAKYAFGSRAVPSAFVATGQAFPDALSASAYAGSKGMPVVLVNGTSRTVPSSLTAWLKSAHTTSVSIAGGTTAVSPGIQSALTAATRHTVERFGGTDRYATSQLIDNQFGNAPTAYLATGANFPDALTGAAAAGKADAPLFMVQSTCVPRAALNSFTKWKTTTAKALGGTTVLTSGVTSLRACS